MQSYFSLLSLITNLRLCLLQNKIIFLTKGWLNFLMMRKWWIIYKEHLMRWRKILSFIFYGIHFKRCIIAAITIKKWFSVKNLLKYIKFSATGRFLQGKYVVVSFKILTNESFPTGKLTQGKTGRMVSLFLWR